MAAAPVEVGAQGTVGSLVLREVEYFRRMEVAGGHGKKSSSKVVGASGGSGSGSPWSDSGKKPKPTTKKKGAVAAGNGSFLPRMCSSAEVAEDPGSGRRERPSRVRYRPLGDDDGDALPQQD
ncbi:hypothetical protein BDA96_01G197300 [Sorghum bicolor]|jgi:hypothetical protein|uniref:Uncharacterized protein n=2 Tax=Sorghum bicolor TaxID=4558 RepID=A0A921V0N8_SORBI|nr:uncharacterized protein LOC8065658 [Sorghum bicolor]EER91333.1 hypothetical protein SORBI_3001G187700 [Sorghum bicolor]KAG0548786.1 hypothetical protein BDA96_01G197300 [Sorghum bicolor]|eukprot:XP_002464335.1 uncharacterized protein LOC8065658 [Sorghum bicolor]